jgi:hypothetical protein
MAAATRAVPIPLLADADVADDLAVDDRHELGQQVVARTHVRPQVGDLVAVLGAAGTEGGADHLQHGVRVARLGGTDLEVGTHRRHASGPRARGALPPGP